MVHAEPVTDETDIPHGLTLRDLWIMWTRQIEVDAILARDALLRRFLHEEWCNTEYSAKPCDCGLGTPTPMGERYDHPAPLRQPSPFDGIALSTYNPATSLIPAIASLGARCDGCGTQDGQRHAVNCPNLSVDP